MNKKIQNLLQDVEYINQSITPVWEAWQQSLSYLGISKSSPWYDLGQSFIQQLGDLQYSENAYHNQFHSAEAILSSCYLIQSEFQAQPINILQYYGPILLFSMMCHDIEHNGEHNNYPYELEQKAVKAIQVAYQNNLDLQQIWSKLEPIYGQWSEFFSIVESIILGTDFKLGPPKNANNYLNSQFNPQQSFNDYIDQLKMLANESDILLSVLSPTGVARGVLLAKEQQKEEIASWAGRLFFLDKLVTYVSQSSIQLGIQKHIQEQINIINSVGIEALEKMTTEQGLEKTNIWFNKQLGISSNENYIQNIVNIREKYQFHNKSKLMEAKLKN